MALGGSACTGDGNSSRLDSVRLIGSVTAKSTSTSARFAVEVTSFGGEGDDDSIRGVGVFDYPRMRGAILERSGGQETGFGPGDEIRAFDDTIYLREPGHYAGRPWRKTDVADLESQNRSASFAYAAVFLVYLNAEGGRIIDETPDTIRGTPTTKLRVTLSVRRVQSRMGPTERIALAPLIAAFAASSTPADIWIDDQGRLQRMTLSRFGEGAQGSISSDSDSAFTLRLDLYDYGVPVRVVAPPESQLMAPS
jgi:hypothetical protein